MLRVK